MLLTLDLETTTHNKGNPHDTRNFIVSLHVKSEGNATRFSYYTDADFLGNCKQAMADASLIVGVNCKFDLAHLLRAGVKPKRGIRIWDCQLAEFILSGQTNSFFGLDKLVELYVLGVKDHTIDDYWAQGISTEDIPKDVVEQRGNSDVDLTYQVYLRQRTDPRMTPALEKLILLSGLDMLVLLEMEHNGFKYNVEGSRKRAEVLGRELEAIETELNSHTHTRINWDSGDQLSCFLYGGIFTEDVYLPVERIYKSGPNKGETYIRNEFQYTLEHTFAGHYVPLKGTALAKSSDTRRLYSTAEDVLLKLKSRNRTGKQIITLLLRRSTIAKLIGTYLNAMPTLIETMSWKDNYVHGQFNQVVARTGRLSSSRPNMQNAPEEVDEFFVSRYAC